ncbi:TPA: sulfopyruvate decarboxylase subunit alpha [bacterium]|nr:sulfopyruvate decarboxylase subunit alpha [bacterium]
MVKVGEFWNYLKNRDYRFFSGVPCSLLANILEYAFKDQEIRYVPAVRENAALGIASGAYLAGRKSGILIQNSGLGNIVNALTSFNLIYKIPVLMFITWRGYLGKDAPEHLIMGEKMVDLLNILKIPNVVLSEKFTKDIAQAIEWMEIDRIPAAVIIQKGVIG